MDPEASFLLESLNLDSSDPQTLTSQFFSYLQPLLNISNEEKEKGQTSTTLSRLAKKFLPFLSAALYLFDELFSRRLPSLDANRVLTLLEVYRLVLDSLWSIFPRLSGKMKNSTLVHRGVLIGFLKQCGMHEKAKEEVVSLLKMIGIDVGGGVYGPLGDPDLERQIVVLIWDGVCSLVECAYKRKSKDGEEYELILRLVEFLAPKLRALDSKSMRKYHPILVNSLHKCSLVFAAEHISFDTDLVIRFCQMVLLECLQSSMMDRFLNISRSICKSFDKWEMQPFLILGLLRVTLKSILCGCKAGVLKVVDGILKFVEYCCENFAADNIDVCSQAVELLYEQGGDFVPVSPPVASIMSVYATGLYLKYNNVQAKHELEVLSLNEAPKKLGVFSNSVGFVTKHFNINEVSQCTCTKLHGLALLDSYLDAMDFFCIMIVEYVNLTWKFLTLEGKAVFHSDNINVIHETMQKFCLFVLNAFRSQPITEGDKTFKTTLQESQMTLLHATMSAFKLYLGTSSEQSNTKEQSNTERSLWLLDLVISSECIDLQGLMFLLTELTTVGTSLYDVGQLKQASVAFRLCCKTIWAQVNLLCRLCSDKSKEIQCGDKSDELLDKVTRAFKRCALVLDKLHKCGSADDQNLCVLKGDVYVIAAKCLAEFSAYNMFTDSTGPFVLVKQWAKMLCSDFKDADRINDAPVLYSFLKTHCPTWSNLAVGKILEQELLEYDVMEDRNPDLSRKMQLRVLDFLLDEVFTAREYNLQRARILVRKGRYL